jgi:putative FmdB family regulatory protein
VPTYQYACTACSEQFEVVQKFTDASLTECPSCKGRLRKVFSPVGIVFKGSGFYRTDNRSSSSSSTTTTSSSNGSKDSGSSSSTSSDASSNGAKSESKSDSKPAASTTSAA